MWGGYKAILLDYGEKKNDEAILFDYGKTKKRLHFAKLWFSLGDDV